jgi:hypothetical protein
VSKQLNNINLFTQRLFQQIKGRKDAVLPTAKLIIVPDESSPSPELLTPEGCKLVFKDICDNFNSHWETITDGLQTTEELLPFTAEDFEQLVEILVGLWSSKAILTTPWNVRPRAYDVIYEESKASVAQQIEKIDNKVNTADICSVPSTAEPLTTIVRTEPTDVFRSSNELMLYYLSPSQKQLYDSYKQCIVRASAGCKLVSKLT